MGRDKRNENRKEHFTKLVRQMMEAPAWQALSPVAQSLYPWLKLEWNGPQANNNGKVRLSTRQASERMGVNAKTAMRGFHELQAKGFIVVTEGARLGVGGEAKSPSFEITELPLPGAESSQGRRLYLDWRENCDFPVTKAAVNNPFGSAGKTKPQSKNGNSTVVNFGTKR